MAENSNAENLYQAYLQTSMYEVTENKTEADNKKIEKTKKKKRFFFFNSKEENEDDEEDEPKKKKRFFFF